MNVTNLIVTLCFVVGYAAAIHKSDEDELVRATLKRSAKEAVKEGKEKRFINLFKGDSCRAPKAFSGYKGQNPDAADHCFSSQAPIFCNPFEKHRKQDGSCNNQFNPTWGQSSTQFIRVIPNRWNDSISIPRKSNKKGSDPQNVRTCRLHLLKTKDKPDKKLTVNVMSVGQFLAHDTFASATFDTTCCPINTEPQEQCWSIDIPHDDPIYKDNDGCLSLDRVQTTKNNCTVKGGPQQINRNTGIIDLDHFLGRDLETSLRLRNVENGTLKVQWIVNKYGHVGQYYPNADDIQAFCNGNYPGETICYQTSDERINQNPWLQGLHVVFLREFNRVAEYLHKINPHWDGEKVYQEAREIVIAEFQKIIAYDWLPFVIGEDKVNECGLGKPPPGKHSNYDVSLHPNAMAESAIVAFRILHTIIPDHLCMFDSGDPHHCGKNVDLEDRFNRCGTFPSDHLDGIIRSLCFQPTKDDINSEGDGVGNHLFKKPFKKFGADLSAIDMQRGIETGVATYNDLREYCKLPRIESFDEFEPKLAKTLEECYDSPDDIDGIIGVTKLEDPVPGGIVGETGACIIAEQFKRWRFGDSWWYDGEKNRNKFTKEQIIELQENVDLKKIYCDNGNDITEINENIWEVPGRGNKVVPCKSIPPLNLDLWKDSGSSFSLSGLLKPVLDPLLKPVLDPLLKPVLDPLIKPMSNFIPKFKK